MLSRRRRRTASGGSTTRIAVDANTVLSGLFFRGNERQLLLQSLVGNIVLVFAEDVVEEVYAVIQETFRNHTELLRALEFLEAVFGAGELLARREYRSQIDAWRHRIRDPKDAPLAAAALVARVDGLVTGDKDLLDVERVGTIPVLRTRKVLDLLSDKQ